jgi:hypothetical protein
MHRQKQIMLFFMFVVALSIPSCSNSQVRIGWVGTQSEDHISSNYELFRGVEKVAFHAQEGQSVFLSLNTEVEDGTLEIRVMGPNGFLLWDKAYYQDAEEQVNIPLDCERRYDINIIGHHTRGKFDIYWELR